MPEPRDLTPEELMALFPTTHAERDQSEPGAAHVQDAQSAAEPLLAPPVAAAPADSAPVEPAPAPEPAGVPTATVIAASVPTVLVGAPTASPPPAPSATVETAPAEFAPATITPAAQPRPGVRLTTGAALAGGASSLLNFADDGLPKASTEAEVILPANAALTRMFVPDARLMTLWLEIDSVEADVTSAKGVSSGVASAMLDCLMRARNLLMNNRAQYEEAARNVAEVKFHLTRLRSATFLHKPTFISLYLLVFFGVVVAGAVFGQSLPWDRFQVFNTRLDMLWYTMLVGGIGGFTGAAYSLVAHGARDRDFDPQYALWYYENPWLGLVLGFFVFIAIYILMNMGTLIMNGQVTNGSLISQLITLFFAWLVGFKHNIAFDLADMAMKKLLPADDATETAVADIKPK